MLTLVFLYVPLGIVAIYAFNDAIGQSWPIQDYTTKWFGDRVPRAHASARR